MSQDGEGMEGWAEPLKWKGVNGKVSASQKGSVPQNLKTILERSILRWGLGVTVGLARHIVVRFRQFSYAEDFEKHQVLTKNHSR